MVKMANPELRDTAKLYALFFRFAMTVEIIKGNIFTTNCQTIVNAVNCVGVMGAGIALEFKLRYPEMFARYVNLCDAKQLDIGKLWIYKFSERWVLNFPTKKHWKYPSKLEYLEAGLQKFTATYAERGISSIAFPLLGADRGGVDPHQSQELLVRYLEPLDLQVEIYQYDRNAKDDLYEDFANKLRSQTIEQIALATSLRKNYIEKVLEAIETQDIHQINQLGHVKGIGIKTIEKIFSYAFQSTDDQSDSNDTQSQIRFDL